uniref:Ig-like domain-containing protein n=1 Tax=Seriola dumerili TaxID=41447 RepID=A0A3B4T5I9_SERDU
PLFIMFLLFSLLMSSLMFVSDVNQTPILWKNKGDNATIHCNHTKGFDYFQMYWYRQLPGENIKLIVFTTTSKNDFGDFDKKKFSATRPGAESGTFTVGNLEPGDQGLYFCAVSQHSDTDTCGS